MKRTPSSFGATRATIKARLTAAEDLVSELKDVLYEMEDPDRLAVFKKRHEGKFYMLRPEDQEYVEYWHVISVKDHDDVETEFFKFESTQGGKVVATYQYEAKHKHSMFTSCKQIGSSEYYEARIKWLEQLESHAPKKPTEVSEGQS